MSDDLDDFAGCDAVQERHSCVRPPHSDATPHECFCGHHWGGQA
jgi:hypothetical protein